MACSYNFEIPVDPMALLPIVRQEIEQNGGVVTGEVPSLAVKIPTPVGGVEGTCKLIGPSLVNIEITKMPPVVTCAMVRDNLVAYLTAAVKTYSQQKKAAQQHEGQVVA